MISLSRYATSLKSGGNSKTIPPDMDSWFTISPTWVRKSSLYGAIAHSNSYYQSPQNRSILRYMPNIASWSGNNPDIPSSPFSIRNELNNAPKNASSAPLNAILPPKLLFCFEPNNTFALLTGLRGKLLSKWSAGSVGFEGTHKLTDKATFAMLDKILEKLDSIKLGTIRLDFRGVNPARQVVLSQLKRTGLRITEIMDSTPIALTGGPRPKKARRI
jgi:ribosomal protein S11